LETWYYTQGTNGETEITISELANKEIKGRIYRSGKEFRPTQNEDNIPTDKEYFFESVLGKFFFAFPFDGSETLDIPYET
jgi:hypothetical protein